eukprot:13802286-Ditylum_brightwellii.AAC.1
MQYTSGACLGMQGGAWVGTPVWRTEKYARNVGGTNNGANSLALIKREAGQYQVQIQIGGGEMHLENYLPHQNCCKQVQYKEKYLNPVLKVSSGSLHVLCVKWRSYLP